MDHYICKNCDAKLNELMNYCFNCGKKHSGPDSEEIKCNNCKRTVHISFNYCYECGEDLNPGGWNQPKAKIEGYSLKFKCDCGGKVQEFMAYCPWCGEQQVWENRYGNEYCKNCESNLSKDWYYCVFCGALIDKKDPNTWTRKKGYLRPFQALVSMPYGFRENIRKTLNFNWADKSKSKSDWQAKEILDCDLRGIIARFNNTAQQLVPYSRNVSWREILERILSDFHIKYPAHLSEKELELLLMEKTLKSNINSIKDTTANLNKVIGDSPHVAALVLLMFGNIDTSLSGLLDTSNKPGYSAVLSICIWLHKSRLGEKS